MGPLWHELSAQALNHDENYACRCANDFGDRSKIWLLLHHGHSVLVNRWGR